MGIEYYKGDYNRLSHYEKQAILYFKLHFHITDMMEDLKVFVGEQYDLHIEQVDEYSIYHFVVKLYIKLVNRGIINVSYENFITNLFDRGTIYISLVGMITKLRSEIQKAATKELELGEPDYSLLPKRLKKER